MLLALKILVLLAPIIFFIGMIKPKWILFWMKEPDRLSITVLAMVMFMSAWTGIAKMTMQPRPKDAPKPEHQLEQENELQLDRMR